MGKTLNKARRKAARDAILAVRPASKPLKVTNSGLSDRISALLICHRWDEALEVLGTMQSGGLTPKLGSLQRWVRQADLCGNEVLAARLLAGILHTTGFAKGPLAAQIITEQPSPGPDPPCALDAAHPTSWDRQGAGSAPVRRHPVWVPPACSQPADTLAPSTSYTDRFRAVQPELKSQQPRQAGMRLDPKIFVTPPHSVAFTQLPPATCVRVPNVPGAFVMTGVISSSVCQQLLTISEAMGYAPDVDYSFSPDGTSDASAARGAAAAVVTAGAGERASGCVWLADDSLLIPIFERCKPLLPQELGGGALAGLNARLRFYRYEPGNVYRPHVDGAWPGSGLASDGSYVFDAHGGTRWSRLTFLMYLNDGFEGGATTFYLPAPDDACCLDAHSVAPRAGNVLCFPHGEAIGSLVHEGSAVLSGVKYVIRTDVLYIVPPRARGGARGAMVWPSGAK